MRLFLMAALLMATLAAGGCNMLRWHSDDYYTQLAVDGFVEAQLALEQQDDEAALEALNRAVDADPTLSNAYAAIGDIYQKREDLSKAVAAYEQAVAVNAWNFRNHYNCGTLHKALADEQASPAEVTAHLERSVELYTRAVQLYGKDYDAQLNLGVCLFLLQRYDQAEAAYKRAIELKGDIPDGYTNLGLLYDIQGEDFDAIAMYNRSLELDARQVRVLMNLAAVQARQDRFDPALGNYRRAADIDPGNPDILERLGYCHFQKGDVEQALADYRSALELAPRMALAHRGLGVVLISRYLADASDTAARDEAIDHWRTSLDIDNDQPELKKLLTRFTPKD